MDCQSRLWTQWKNGGPKKYYTHVVALYPSTNNGLPVINEEGSASA